MSANIDKAIESYREFLGVLEPKLEEAIADGRNLPITVFAKEICGRFGWEWTTAYNMCIHYASTRSDIQRYLGPKGGLGKKENVNSVVNEVSV